MLGFFSRLASRAGKRVLGGGGSPLAKPVFSKKKVAPPGIVPAEKDMNPPVGIGGTAVAGAFHHGGTVKKDGVYALKKGEKVEPATVSKKKTGRQSKYRAVYLERKKEK